MVENFQGALRAFILTDSAIVASVSGRIYTPPVPQGNPYPYITIQPISNSPMNSLLKYQGVDEDRWQIDVYSESSDTRDAIAKLIFNKLHFKNNTIWSDYEVYLVLQQATNNMIEPRSEGSERVIYRIQQDFFIKHNAETGTLS